ncbi:MAG: biotin--[acetyl-CoA-carboxylase] ligase [Alistipes sp.]|jgi:BirA family biotin operon repressor/biotin-[acetyl-CoA-carboxylase] ligase|nr:biotin--[acetyl-CoA-carboxylase] ligase [Alistipes sp.]
MIHYIEQTTSTNDEARKECYDHLDAIWSEYQTSGRGQRGHSWHSAEGENVTFSVVLKPTFLPVVEQFLLSEVVALALVDTMAEYGIECRIKWTNDLYAGDSKLAGVLIEHQLSTEGIVRTIVGIGLNINQREFPADLPNPTSMALLRSASFDRREVLERYMANLEAWYGRLLEGNKSAIEERYRELMYHLDEQHIYALASGEKFRAIIRGVRPSGELRLEHEDGTIREYAFKEVEFVLPHKQ